MAEWWVGELWMFGVALWKFLLVCLCVFSNKYNCLLSQFSNIVPWRVFYLVFVFCSLLDRWLHWYHLPCLDILGGWPGHFSLPNRTGPVGPPSYLPCSCCWKMAVGKEEVPRFLQVHNNFFSSFLPGNISLMNLSWSNFLYTTAVIMDRPVCHFMDSKNVKVQVKGIVCGYISREVKLGLPSLNLFTTHCRVADVCSARWDRVVVGSGH